MELGDLKSYVENANPEQLQVIATLGAWLGDMSPKYCNCPSKCNETCPIAGALFESIGLAAKRLE